MNKGDDEQIEQKDQIEDEKEIAEAVKYTPLQIEQKDDSQVSHSSSKKSFVVQELTIW